MGESRYLSHYQRGKPGLGGRKASSWQLGPIWVLPILEQCWLISQDDSAWQLLGGQSCFHQSGSFGKNHASTLCSHWHGARFKGRPPSAAQSGGFSDKAALCGRTQLRNGRVGGFNLPVLWLVTDVSTQDNLCMTVYIYIYCMCISFLHVGIEFNYNNNFPRKLKER